MKTTKSAISMIVTFALVATILPGVIIGQTSYALNPPDPITISNCEELQLIGNDLAYPLDGAYVLNNDIDCSLTNPSAPGWDDLGTWGDGKGFDPIGDDTTQFTGTFDGAGFKVTSLYINRVDENYVGLVGYAGVGANIYDLGVEDVALTGQNHVGGLAGMNYGNVSDSYTTGSVTADLYYAGGLVGLNYGTISRSYSACSATTNLQFAGGLVGLNRSSATISESYATGTVFATDMFAGGLVGRNELSSTISDSYATGSVTADSFAGGLVGVNRSDSIISKSYSIGSVTANTYYGGLVGEDNAVTENSFWNKETSGVLFEGGGVGKTTVELKDMDTYTVVQQLASIGGGWQSVSSGQYHTLAIRDDGTLWAWGDNFYGQLGLGHQSDRNEPVKVGQDNDWKSVSAGSVQSLAIKNDGTLWSWGGNYSGQLGFGDIVDRYVPTQLGVDIDWQSTSTRYDHSLAIKNDGTIWAWGVNSYGQLGLGDENNRDVPVQISGSSDWKAVSTGEEHTLAVRTDGTLWGWGYNFYGQLGNGESGSTANKNVPTQAGVDIDWQATSAGYDFSFGIKTGGTLWSWGYNWYGQLGLGDSGTGTNRAVPTQIGGGIDWQEVTAGESHTLAIRDNGTLWAWGNNSSGQLGLGDSGFGTNRVSPEQVGVEIDWQVVSAGDEHTLAIRDGGTLWAWGTNSDGQLGLGPDTSVRAVPTQILIYGFISGSEGLDEVWDFDDIWIIDSTENNGYPFLRWQIDEPDEPEDKPSGGGGGIFLIIDPEIDYMPPGDEAPEEEEETSSFLDIIGHWSEDFINDLYNRGIVDGYSDEYFGPDNDTKRSEFVKIVINAMGFDLITEVEGEFFSDVDLEEWYAPYIITAKHHGIIDGYDDGTFKPNARINRAEAVKILVLATYQGELPEYQNVFSDVLERHWFAPYVIYAYLNDIVVGYADGTFGSGRNITRAEVAKIIVLMIE